MTDSRAVVQSTAKYSVYLGTFIHSKSLGEVEILHDNAIYVNEQGRIVVIAKGVDDDSVRSHLSRLGWPQGSVVVRACEKEQFFFPGFIGNASHCRTPSSKYLEMEAYVV
jgi:guanine deaminase